MGTKYRTALSLSFLAIIFVLIFCAFHFIYMDMPHGQAGFVLSINILSNFPFAGNDMKQGALLVVGVTALMAGGVLWSVVNYKE